MLSSFEDSETLGLQISHQGKNGEVCQVERSSKSNQPICTHYDLSSMHSLRHGLHSVASAPPLCPRYHSAPVLCDRLDFLTTGTAQSPSPLPVRRSSGQIVALTPWLLVGQHQLCGCQTIAFAPVEKPRPNSTKSSGQWCSSRRHCSLYSNQPNWNTMVDLDVSTHFCSCGQYVNAGDRRRTAHSSGSTQRIVVVLVHVLFFTKCTPNMPHRCIQCRASGHRCPRQKSFALFKTIGRSMQRFHEWFTGVYFSRRCSIQRYRCLDVSSNLSSDYVWRAPLPFIDISTRPAIFFKIFRDVANWQCVEMFFVALHALEPYDECHHVSGARIGTATVNWIGSCFEK